MNNFNIIACDTDSIFFKKQDESIFTEQEIIDLQKSLNSLYPEGIHWELNGVFQKILTFKAKNYILYDGKTVKYKGSALRSPKLEKALNEFIQRMVESMLHDETNYVDIYNEYVKEIDNIKDINRWAARYTISAKTLESERTNESKVRDALIGSEYVENDRVYLFFNVNDELTLVENYKGEYNKDRLYEKLHKTALRFSTLLDKTMFINYKLKKNKKLLECILK